MGNVGLGILIIILTVLFGWLGGGICMLAGLLIGIILIIIGLVNPEKKDDAPSRLSDRYCPNCGRAIPFDARVCPYCGKKFEDDIPMNDNVKTQKFVEFIEKAKEEKEAERDKVETIQEEKKMKICLSCGYENKLTSKFCKKCGTKLGE